MSYLFATEQDKNRIITKYGRLDIEELENPFRIFDVGILDVYERCLTSLEAEKLIVNYRGKKFFRIGKQSKYFTQERQFLSVFNMIWKLNGKEPVYIYFHHLSTLSKYEIKYILKNLNSRDRALLKNVIMNYPLNGFLIKTCDFNLLSLFVKLSTRQQVFSNFFFHSGVIIGNFDCSFPVYALDKQAMDCYRAIANSEGLYIRGN